MYNEQRLKLVDALDTFQQQIDTLQADLDSYSARPDASQRAIFYKKQQIGIFKQVLDSFREFQTNIDTMFFDLQKEFAKVEDDATKLYAACLLHGIANINSYLRMETKNVLLLLQEANQDGWRQMPLAFLFDDNTRCAGVGIADKPTVPFNLLKQKALTWYE